MFSPQQHGFPCPECNNYIQTNMQQLIVHRKFFCSSCGLELNVDMDKSSQVIDEIKKLDDVTKNAEAVKEQYR